jgi:hypothetical protein
MHNQINALSLRIAAVAYSIASLTVSAIGAEVINESFDVANEGQLASSPAFMAWTGPEFGLYGKIDASAELTPNGTGKALVFRDNAPEANKGPALTASWEGSAPKSGHVIVSWKWMVAVDGPFLALQFAGVSWDDTAAVFILENGKVTIQHEKNDNRETLGDYRPREWRSVKMDFDIDKRTFDIYLDDRKVADALRWQGTRPTIDKVSMNADFAAVDRQGNPVFAIDDFKVETK